jgi:hypothetical protein
MPNIERYEYEDRFHPYWEEYYDCLELMGTANNLLLIAKLQRLSLLDQDYLHPILLIADIEREMGNEKRADELVTEAFDKVKSIVYRDGRWPDRMSWGWDENRHLLRALEDYADMRWRQSRLDEALDVFRRIFSMNLYDNQGIRFKILAMRMNYSFNEHTGKNDSSNEDFGFWSEQFSRYAKEFPEDFKQWINEFGK